VSSDKGIKTGDKWEERITEKGAVSEELEIYQSAEITEFLDAFNPCLGFPMPLRASR
jgi:hypothetical protein